MKQVKIFFVTVMLIISFAGCASNSVESSNAEAVHAPEEIVRFDDWQYKGFGYELPRWVDSALEGKLSSADSKVFTARGINSDMSEQKLQEIISVQVLEGYELTGSTWVRVSDTGEYISVKIYKKKEL